MHRYACITPLCPNRIDHYIDSILYRCTHSKSLKSLSACRLGSASHSVRDDELTSQHQGVPIRWRAML